MERSGFVLQDVYKRQIILGGFSFSGDMSKFLFYSFGYCPFKGGETLMIISIYDKKR